VCASLPFSLSLSLSLSYSLFLSLSLSLSSSKSQGDAIARAATSPDCTFDLERVGCTVQCGLPLQPDLVRVLLPCNSSMKLKSRNVTSSMRNQNDDATNVTDLSLYLSL